ncbi:MAG: T9SS type A sorting domain-containing protein [Ignavibacteria bacterium]|nr:T9SS type A sorting domain-containing protein [Ignavibacteria bacterium]
MGWAAGTKYPGAEGLILKTTTGGLTFINNIVSQIPVKFQLHQNYPNPFNPATVIRYDIPVSGKTSIKIYNQLGGEVAILINEYISAGSYQVKFNAGDYATGVYFYKLVSVAGSVTKKMIYIR